MMGWEFRDMEEGKVNQGQLNVNGATRLLPAGAGGYGGAGGPGDTMDRQLCVSAWCVGAHREERRWMSACLGCGHLGSLYVSLAGRGHFCPSPDQIVLGALFERTDIQKAGKGHECLLRCFIHP